MKKLTLIFLALLLAGNSHSALTLYNTETAEIEQIVTINQPSYVQDVAFSADGTILAASLYNNMTYTWSLSNKAPIHILRIASEETSIAGYLSLSPDGNLAAFGVTSDNQVLVWDLKKGQQLFVLSMGTTQESYWNKRNLVFSPDGKTLVTAARDNLIRWDVLTGIQTGVFRGSDQSDFIFPSMEKPCSYPITPRFWPWIQSAARCFPSWSSLTAGS